MRIALPKGRLLPSTSVFWQKAGLELSDYDEQSRSYRPQCSNLPDLSLKIFHEKDIPVQVAVGNYDLGVCGIDWVEELLVKYPNSSLVKVRNLGYGRRDLYIAASKKSDISSLETLKNKIGTIRIATEYPNLAESFALNMRLKRFNIFPLWGAAEAYPPEGADIVLMCGNPPFSFLDHDLFPLTLLLESRAVLIAHRRSWESKDMGDLLRKFYTVGNMDEGVGNLEVQNIGTGDIGKYSPDLKPRSFWLAIPDGHQQKPALEFLNQSGVKVWNQTQNIRRPSIDIDEVCVKLIRPQDMPLQVANGNFELAITGQDWLYDHLYKFPTSPVKELLELGFGKVRIVAVVRNELPVSNLQELKEFLNKGGLSNLRIASEYVNIADKYARDNHLSPYRLIPTWGASEVFLPEDADLLIENVQTGRTLARHNLKIIDTLFESSACLIGNSNSSGNGYKREKSDTIIQILKKTLVSDQVNR